MSSELPQEVTHHHEGEWAFEDIGLHLVSQLPSETLSVKGRQGL